MSAFTIVLYVYGHQQDGYFSSNEKRGFSTQRVKETLQVSGVEFIPRAKGACINEEAEFPT